MTLQQYRTCAECLHFRFERCGIGYHTTADSKACRQFVRRLTR